MDESELAAPHPVRAMSGLIAHARYHGPVRPTTGPDVPVLLRRKVLREAAEAATAAGTLEPAESCWKACAMPETGTCGSRSRADSGARGNCP